MTAQLKQKVILPSAAPAEDPVSFSERLAIEYGARLSDAYRKRLGIFFTPASVARHMGRLCRNGDAHFVRIADPAAGTGILACAAAVALAESVNAPRHIELHCHEVDEGVRESLEAALAHLRKWLLMHRKIHLRFTIDPRDFLLVHASALSASLFSEMPRFDAVICNPPYFKLPKADRRVQSCSPLVHGQPNIYGLFMGVAAAALRPGGRFVFITPRSFASGPYFERFREFFFNIIRPTDVHIFDSRSEAFSDVLQETAITAGTRLEATGRRLRSPRLRISTSRGAATIDSAIVRTLPLSAVLHGDSKHRVFSFPASPKDDQVAAIVRKWPGSLHSFGWEVSTGPVVAFRARRFLSHQKSRAAVPLLWLQNLFAMEVRWPLTLRKPQYLRVGPGSEAVAIPSANYVLIRRFSAKEERRRLTAAPYIPKPGEYARLGVENHLNYVHKPQGELSNDECFGLAAVLNSELMDTYFRISNGNTQVSATELRSLPLPPLDTLRRIGARVRKQESDPEAIVRKELRYAG